MDRTEARAAYLNIPFRRSVVSEIARRIEQNPALLDEEPYRNMVVPDDGPSSNKWAIKKWVFPSFDADGRSYQSFLHVRSAENDEELEKILGSTRDDDVIAKLPSPGNSGPQGIIFVRWESVEKLEPNDPDVLFHFIIYMDRSLCPEVDPDKHPPPDQPFLLCNRTWLFAMEYLCCVNAYNEIKQSLQSGSTIDEIPFITERHTTEAEADRLVASEPTIFQCIGVIENSIGTNLRTGERFLNYYSTYDQTDGTAANFHNFWMDEKRVDPVKAYKQTLLRLREQN